jgi:hypothetical protein
MKIYEKLVNGLMITKPAKSIVILKDGMKIFNPNEEQILSDGWVECITDDVLENIDDVTEDDILEEMKSKLRDDIIAFDCSDKVNIFFINDIPLWLDKTTRASLMLRFQAELNSGKEYTSIFYGTDDFTVPVKDAIDMLYALELYASTCYDITQKHINNVSLIKDIEGLHKYRYITSYPTPIHFSI